MATGRLVCAAPLLLLAACAAEQEPDWWQEVEDYTPGLEQGDRPLAAVGDLAVSVPSLIIGDIVDVAISGAQSYEEVFLLMTTKGLGPGPCISHFGGMCTDLAPPLSLLGRDWSTLDGDASVSFRVPDREGTELCFQAAVRRGPGGLNSELSPTQCATIVTEIPPGTGAVTYDELSVSGSLYDFDVAEDGTTAVLAINGSDAEVTCFEGDGTERKAAFSVGHVDGTNAAGIFMSRTGGAILVVWRNTGAVETLRYSYLDGACNPMVTDAELWSGGYFEFFDAAIGDDGRAVVAYSSSQTHVAWIDASGLVTGTEEAYDIGALYGTHVALNPATGGGILAAQIHSGNGIYYQRFDAARSWIDAAPVWMDTGNYHYWYDGFTVGMNENDDYVFLWRSDGHLIDMRFFEAGSGSDFYVQRTTPDFEGWGGGHCYDSFRRRHQEIPLNGNNFVLGEVYNWIAGDNLDVFHFEYTPTGSLISEGTTNVSIDEGLTLRCDGTGTCVARDNSVIKNLGMYP